MKKLILLFIFLLTINSLSAQIDSIYKAYQRDFNAYKDSVENEFNKYKSEQDLAFQRFLKKRWKDFDVFLSSRPIRYKPKEQPIINDQSDTFSRRLEYSAQLRMDTIEIKGKLYLDAEEKTPVIKTKSRFIKNKFNFFGTTEEIFFPTDKLPHFDFLDQKSIDKFTKELASNDSLWNINLYFFKKKKEKYKLNDWGYYLLLKKAAESIFLTPNEQILFIWTGLVKSGYEAKIGFDKTQVYLMLPSIHQLFDIHYINIDGRRYYLFESSNNKLGQIKTFEGGMFNNGKYFSFELNELPLFIEEKKITREISYNNQLLNINLNSRLIDFFSTYPSCALELYCRTPISTQSIQSLNQLFIPLFSRKTAREKVNILLNFIQKSFAYKSDIEQFGKERCFFAEESLFYPYTDCEDRSVLLAMLIKYYIGLETVILDFPKHIAIAVYLPNEEEGTHYLIRGKKYIVCDPTYINAKCGMLHPDLYDIKPQIIKI